MGKAIGGVQGPPSVGQHCRAVPRPMEVRHFPCLHRRACADALSRASWRQRFNLAVPSYPPLRCILPFPHIFSGRYWTVPSGQRRKVLAEMAAVLPHDPCGRCRNFAEAGVRSSPSIIAHQRGFLTPMRTQDSAQTERDLCSTRQRNCLREEAEAAWARSSMPASRMRSCNSATRSLGHASCSGVMTNWSEYRAFT